MTAQDDALQNPDEGQPAAEATPGNVEVDPFNPYKDLPSPKEVPAVEPANEDKQPTPKDERHFSRKIQELSEERIELAKLAIDADPDKIYDIAKRDKKLASKLLKDYDYGTDDVEELLAKQEDPDASPEELRQKIQEQTWRNKVEGRLMDDLVYRLRRENPDLDRDLEEEFRNLYSNQTLQENYSADKLLDMARAITGNTPQRKNTNDVALEMLKRDEGAITVSRGQRDVKKEVVLTDEQRKRYELAGVTESDLERYGLVEDIPIG